MHGSDCFTRQATIRCYMCGFASRRFLLCFERYVLGFLLVLTDRPALVATFVASVVLVVVCLMACAWIR